MREEQLPSAGGAVRPGSMTTAMRAVTQAGASARLAVRVAIARRGSLEREWIVENGELAIGRSERADVVDAALPFDRAVVLRVSAEQTELVVPIGARGRVQSGGGMRGLEELAGASLVLDETARGRLVLGTGADEIAILFQRVPAPPARTRPALPSAVQQRLFDRVDWFFTAIAAASFMLHFAGIVALTEADWPMPPSLAEITERDAVILFAEETPPPPELPTVTEPTIPSDRPETPVAHVDRPITPVRPERPSTPTRAPTQRETIASVETQVDQAIALLIGASGPDGHFASLIDHGAAITPMGELMAQVDGVAVASTDPGFTPRTGSHSGQPHDISALRPGVVDGHEHVEGTDLVEHPVHVTVTIDPIDDPEPLDPNWDERLLRAAVQRRMSGIQHCYETELTRNPELAGRLTVSMRVEEVGALSHVHTEDDTTGSRPLSECVVRQIQTIRLTAGPEGGIVAEYPIVFAPQR
jgi:hypothetical protein